MLDAASIVPGRKQLNHIYLNSCSTRTLYIQFFIFFGTIEIFIYKFRHNKPPWTIIWMCGIFNCTLKTEVVGQIPYNNVLKLSELFFLWVYVWVHLGKWLTWVSEYYIRKKRQFDHPEARNICGLNELIE